MAKTYRDGKYTAYYDPELGTYDEYIEVLRNRQYHDWQEEPHYTYPNATRWHWSDSEELTPDHEPVLKYWG